MLIFIHPSITNEDLRLNFDAIIGLNQIFESFFRGQHYVAGDRKTLIYLAKCPHIPTSTKTIVNKIISNYSTYTSITSSITNKIVAKINEPKFPIRSNDNEWEVSIEYLGKTGISKTNLIAENLTDADAYINAARHYLINNKLGGTICAEKIAGGGSTTPNVFRNQTINEKKWCLCITDGDKNYPGHKSSNMANSCEKVSNENHSISAHKSIEAKEVENIIPLKLIDDSIPSTHTYQWEEHKNRFFPLNVNGHLFCDLKKGTSYRDINHMHADTPERLFWDELISKAIPSLKINTACNEYCQNEKTEACCCNISHGYGDNLLSEIVRNLKESTPHAVEKKIRNDPLFTQWLQIGEIVFNWVCAPNPIRL